MICIIENSPGLAVYFERFLFDCGVAFQTFPVYSDGIFPIESFDAYMLTGDFSNLSDGLNPYHIKEVDFIKRTGSRRIFGSCFSHHLFGEILGGKVIKRRDRFFGWHEIKMLKNHKVFDGISKPYFLCLNGDEISSLPENASLIGESDDCKYQVVEYDSRILTAQNHPEILFKDASELISRYYNELKERCDDLDIKLQKTATFSDDEKSRVFMANLISWLLE